MLRTGLLFALMIALAGCGNQLHEFSECLTDKGVKMYGAFWCPHCAQQKSMFGSGFERVTYIECSLPDKSGQTQACRDANIQQYPTWEFSDGSRKEGVQALGELSKRSGCALEQ